MGRRNFLDEKLWAMAKIRCARMEFLPDVAQNIVDIALAARGRAIKCVVLDLDNTLVGSGVSVGDDGLERNRPSGIWMKEARSDCFQYHLRELARRGVLLAVCSKNNEALARQVFREHSAMVLKEDHIAVFVANWENKADNIRRIQQQLNIGFDSMVFLDDNPFERNLVRQLVPEIIVPELPEEPALYTRTISELNLFEAASHSALDEKRNALYQDQQNRDSERTTFSNITEYLQSLETTALFSRFEPATI